MGRPKLELSGKINKWEIIERDQSKTEQTYYICKCECGLVKSVNASHLQAEKTKSCRKCSESKDKGKLNSRVFCRLVYNAKERGIEFNLGTREEANKFLYELLVKQGHKCALSGLSIILSTTNMGDRRGESTASVDRKDSLKGYTKDNVQWVHKRVNQIKMDMPETEFVQLCCQITNTQIGKEVSLYI